MLEAPPESRRVRSRKHPLSAHSLLGALPLDALLRDFCAPRHDAATFIERQKQSWRNFFTKVCCVKECHGT